MTEITSIPVPDSQYNEVVILDEYNGVYSLILGKQGDKRNFWKMVHPETRSGPSEKKIPMKVVLGDQHAAANMLRQLAHELEGGDELPPVSQEAPFDDDSSEVPF